MMHRHADDTPAPVSILPPAVQSVLDPLRRACGDSGLDFLVIVATDDGLHVDAVPGNADTSASAPPPCSRCGRKRPRSRQGRRDVPDPSSPPALALPRVEREVTRFYALVLHGADELSLPDHRAVLRAVRTAKPHWSRR